MTGEMPASLVQDRVRCSSSPERRRNAARPRITRVVTWLRRGTMPPGEFSSSHSLSQLVARTVLVVDDDDTIRRLLGKVFTRAGWNVESAAGVSEAIARLALIENQWPELIVCDMEMPYEGGREFARRLRATFPHRHSFMILHSGAVHSSASHAALRRLARAVLLKPESIEVLSSIAAIPPDGDFEHEAELILRFAETPSR